MASLAINIPASVLQPAKQMAGVQPIGFAYRIGWIALVVAAAIAAGILLATGLRLTAGSLLPLLLLLPILICIHLRYLLVSFNAKISDATGGLAIMVSAAILAGLISNAGLRLRMPLIDEPLARLDAMMGLGSGDTHIITMFFGLDGLNRLLEYAYVSSVPLCLVLMLALVVSGRRTAGWETASSFTIMILLSSTVSAFFPAIGNIPYSGLTEIAALHLPKESGTYHLPQFNAFYVGHVKILDMGQLEGVVTFPSFHLAMGLIIARAASQFQRLKFAGLVWGVLIALSTIPIGGHYLVDVVAGGALWIVIIAIFNRPIAKAGKAV